MLFHDCPYNSSAEIKNTPRWLHKTLYSSLGTLFSIARSNKLHLKTMNLMQREKQRVFIRKDLRQRVIYIKKQKEPELSSEKGHGHPWTSLLPNRRMCSWLQVLLPPLLWDHSAQAPLQFVSGAALDLPSMREARANFKLSVLNFIDHFPPTTEYESDFYNYMPVVIFVNGITWVAASGWLSCKDTKSLWSHTLRNICWELRL